MPETFKKSVLELGTYHSPDGPVVVTRDRLKHWEKEFNRLKQNKQVVPVSWDHADDITSATPLSIENYQKKRSAKNTIGHMTDFKVAPDGNRAIVKVKLHDRKASEAAEDNRIFISPVIFDDWKDGAKNTYRDVITHVDMVNHPVDHSQGPFVSMSLSDNGFVPCAIRMGLTAPAFRRLSSDEEELDNERPDDAEGDTAHKKDSTQKKTTPDKHTAKPDQEITAMGDDDEEDYMEDMEEEDDTDVDIDIDVEDEEDDMEYEEEDDYEEPMMDEEIYAPEDEIGEEDILAMEAEMAENAALGGQILEDLAGAGIAPPEGVDPIAEPVPFLQQLCAALRQKKMDEERDNAMEGTDDFGLNNPEDEFGGTMNSSNGEMNVTTPEYAQMSLRLKKSETKASGLEAALVNMHRKEKQTQLDALLKTGRITSAEHEKYSKGLQRVRMSLGEDGQPNRTEIDLFVSSRADLPAGALWPHAQRLSLGDPQVAEPSFEETGVMSAEEIKKEVDAQTSRFPGMYRENGNGSKK